MIIEKRSSHQLLDSLASAGRAEKLASTRRGTALHIEESGIL
jgi:hypothetical protein